MVAIESTLSDDNYTKRDSERLLNLLERYYDRYVKNELETVLKPTEEEILENAANYFGK